MQDTSSQAMTELALGLCMAFFSLMILAMVSMATPSNQASTNANLPLESIKLVQKSDAASKQDINASTPSIVFMWQQTFYDESLSVLSAEAINVLPKPLVIAMSASVPIEQALALQARFAQQQVSFTTFDEQWQARFASL